MLINYVTTNTLEAMINNYYQFHVTLLIFDFIAEVD